MFYKKLIGKQCYLSPIDKEHYSQYTEWVNDMEVSIGLPFSFNILTEEKEREMVANLANKDYHFAIVDLKTDQLIGNIGFPRYNHIHQIGTVGVFIGNKDFWSKAYGQDAMNLLLDFGFNLLNFYNINLTVYDYNKPAYHCYKKVGFKECGRLRGAKMIAGKRYDEIFMDITRDEYKSVYVNSIVDERNNSVQKQS
ncbi:GNAT family N-acetyltransferase [Haloplasma contractile]|uniref:Diamine N-acetyltransferase protein n=1 Tax=Haloplasma contractile SSD-17B TaxID=1033810 RepID=U2DSJ5_9MOLU|nr:GNAT family protein [Haloplasma contractile]ERJ11492.1 diamine N-acetyltransferase protein [Haloplasma contractile SSD-17B]